jgi:hypothetical protein
MRRRIGLPRLVLVLITLAACSGGPKFALKKESTPSTVAPPKISAIQFPKYDGCSLTLMLPEDDKSHNNRFIFNGDMGENGQMNIDSHDVDLKLVKSDKPDSKAKVGDRFSETYSGENLSVRIDYVVKAKGYEGKSYGATITVERNGAKAQVKTVGVAGC